MTDPLRVAVVGATGYAGFELARLLLRHPKIEKPVFYLREGHAGVRCLTELYPQLRGWGEALLQTAFRGSHRDQRRAGRLSLDASRSVARTRARAARRESRAAHRGPQRCISFPRSRNFRALVQTRRAGFRDARRSCLRSAGTLRRRASRARLVANPGCYPTSVILGLRPLVEAGWINTARGIVCDCKSGVSGAGKEPKRETHFVEVNENFRAYGLFTHRHTPEITEHSGLAPENFIFTTHLLPVERGILSTLYMWLNPARRADEIEALYRQYFAARPLVRVLPHGRLPELQHVTHTNFCDIGFALDPAGERLVVVSCLDNLGKGAAGQAVQNMNRMWGYPETAGLL